MTNKIIITAVINNNNISNNNVAVKIESKMPFN